MDARYARTQLTQFFITTQPAEFLNGKHVVFGRVVEGMLVVRKIENVPCGPNNRPRMDVRITGTRVYYSLQNAAKCDYAASDATEPSFVITSSHSPSAVDRIVMAPPAPTNTLLFCTVTVRITTDKFDAPSTPMNPSAPE